MENPHRILCSPLWLAAQITPGFAVVEPHPAR